MAVDQLGLGRIMIKALRYWSVAMELTAEGKDAEGITQERTSIFDLIAENDRYFQDNGSLLILHRNLVLNQDNATAWYWLFNEWELQAISKEEFTDALHTYLAVNGKLDEELAEYHKDQNLEELADLLEVIHAATVARGYSIDELEALRAKKAEKRGGFEDKIFLKRVIE